MERNPADLFHKVTGFSWHDCTLKIDLETDGGSVSIDDELNLFRAILAQLRSADPVSRNILSRNLTFLIIRHSGLRKLLTATFDFDESSQHVTTFDQRFQAMANLIAAPPVICCPLSQYFQQISDQIHSLMKHDASLSENVRSSISKVCTLTVNSMISRNRKLAVKTFIDPIISSLSPPGGSLTPHHSIDIICGLAVADFDLSLLLEAFPAFLFAFCALEQASLVRQPPHSLAISEFLKRIENSVYMMDDALFNHYDACVNRFVVEAVPDGTFSIVFRQKNSLATDSSLANADSVTNSTCMLVSAAFKEEHQIDFLLILLERLSFRHLMSPDCALLLCTLIATLIEKIEPLFAKFPQKWVRFASETLTRLHNDGLADSVLNEKSAAASSDVRMDTLNVVVRILSILVTDRSKLSSDDVHAIRACISEIIKSECESSLRDDLALLMSDLNGSAGGEGHSESRDLSRDSVKKETFDDALRDLNDPLMPTRAHGLICLKRLILSGDAVVLQNWKRVLQLLEISLSDGESYIYLSAINTLAALSLTSPDESLPILMHAFQNEDRTIQERLNVAEVIVRVSRSLGESDSSKYCDLFLETFMHSLKDNDEMIRVSSLSNLAHFCSRLGPSLKAYMGEILHAVRSMMNNDKSIQVKRACFMLLHLTLSGIDGQSFEIVQEHGSQLHSLMLDAYSRDPDDVCRLHAQLALEEMDRIAGERLCDVRKGPETAKLK